jgi:8-oxo-dGTP pyrophosphatase MutT (NUDIX family)
MHEAEGVIRQAGALAVRPGKIPKVLLVRARKDPAHWIFPKGHIDPGETARFAAKRELLEEAGIKADLSSRAGRCTFRLNAETYDVEYFLCRYISTEHAGETGRTPSWYPIDEALNLLTFVDSRRLLKRIAPAAKTMNNAIAKK